MRFKILIVVEARIFEQECLALAALYQVHPALCLPVNAPYHVRQPELEVRLMCELP